MDRTLNRRLLATRDEGSIGFRGILFPVFGQDFRETEFTLRQLSTSTDGDDRISMGDMIEGDDKDGGSRGEYG